MSLEIKVATHDPKARFKFRKEATDFKLDMVVHSGS
jgi:hypothetical protein